MAKKFRTPKTADMMAMSKRALAIIGGLAGGTIIKNAIEKKSGVSGTDLLGLDGATSKFTSPAIVTAAGFLGASLFKDSIAKDVCLGVVAAGGAGLVNAVAGKSLVALGDASEDAPVMLIPGIGDIPEDITYNELPDESEQVTTYNPAIQATDAVELVDYEEVNGVDELL